MNATPSSTPREFCGARVPTSPQISIVTPAYNGLPYIKEAIASVEALAETLDVEHVVADGASCDGSVELLANSLYVRGISQPDDGLYSALNWAIGEARAPYIQWMNADDCICPEFAARAVELLDEFPQIDVVVGSTLFTDANGRIEQRWNYDPFRVGDLWARPEFYLFNFNSAIYRSEVLRQIGEFNQRRFPIAADLDVQMRLIQRARQIVVFDEAAYLFRRHHGSLTQGLDSKVTVRRASVELYKAWSLNRSIPKELRHEFLVMAVELEMGWHLKCLRTGRQPGKALRELAGIVRDHPKEFRAAAPRWLRKWVARKTTPMRVK
jgi:glycosyltransferase involved in cell wall biosynthesis